MYHLLERMLILVTPVVIIIISRSRRYVCNMPDPIVKILLPHPLPAYKHYQRHTTSSSSLSSSSPLLLSHLSDLRTIDNSTIGLMASNPGNSTLISLSNLYFKMLSHIPLKHFNSIFFIDSFDSPASS